MQIARVEIQNYRSIHRLAFPLRRLNVFVGENGVGKTNLYRALELVQAAARGTLARELAGEGGMSSATWTGERKLHEKARITLGVDLAATGDEGNGLAYQVDTGFAPQYVTEIGFPRPKGIGGLFELEPDVKEERLTHVVKGRKHTLLERKGPSGYARDDDGERHDFASQILPSETALASFSDAGRYPDLYLVRAAMQDWRFYHSFRTDRQSSLRVPCLATTTPTLSSDGHDMAAVFATLRWIREDTVDLDRTIADAFPGATIEIPEPGRTASFAMRYAEFPKREFEPSELSDGTLRYLALAAALLGYRLPSFIALNEPETSLHPDLLPPLARLIARAAERTQIWVVTHSAILADTLAEVAGVRPRRVVKRNGKTEIEGLTLSGEFRDDE